MSKIATLLLLCTALFAQQIGTLTDTRDGKIYKTTKIGEQVWMAENLNYKVGDSKCYDNKPSNCSKYGRLYDWQTAMKACPEGWHLPTIEEWDILLHYVDGTSGTESPYRSKTAGKFLKATSDWKENGNGEDKYGFSALPGGDSYYFYDDFRSLHSHGHWWSATKFSNGYAYYRVMDYYLDGVYWFYDSKYSFLSGASVRCLQGPAPLSEPELKNSQNVRATIAQQKGTFTDSRDKKNYKTVKIGKQVWMAENLNYKASGSKCYGEGGKVFNRETKNYDITLSNSEIQANCEKHGRLYNWETAQNVCSDGWHLPSEDEWKTLIDFTNTEKEEDAGDKLKAESGWNSLYGKFGNGTDIYGFSALPGGEGYSVGNFSGIGYYGYWWNSSKLSKRDSNIAFGVGIEFNRESVRLTGVMKSTLRSVRCIQNSQPTTEKIQKQEGSFTDPRDKKNYKTVKIDEQVWMAENMNYNASGSKCYDKKSANCDKYGRLYNWETAKVVCPNGWHLPTKKELGIFYRSADGTEGETSDYESKTAGKFLKATSGWNENGNGEDKFGFSALPGGYGNSGGKFVFLVEDILWQSSKFVSVGNDGYWWASSELTSDYAYYWNIAYSDNYVRYSTSKKENFFSVRCLED